MIQPSLRILLLALGATACSPPRHAPSPQDTAQEPTAPVYEGLLINELMARNDSTIMDTEGGFPDWVELMNLGSESIVMDRLELRDRGDQRWTGTPSEYLDPGEHLLLWAGGSAEDSPKGDDWTKAPFALDAGGESLELLLDGQLVDRVEFGAQQSDVSMARFPDGGAWASTGRPSPGWSNGARPGPIDPTEDIFQIGQVLDLSLWISEESWDLLNSDTNPDPAIHQNLEVPASFAFQGAFFEQVGVHVKGAWGSRRTMEQKVALKVDLDKYQDHRLRGLESVTLNNMVQDLSYVHEHLSYRVFREAGVPAPRVAWVRLQINDKDRGLYLWVESEDSPFLERWYEDSGGNLYEAAYGVDLYQGYEPSFDHEEGPEPADLSDLEAVTAVLSGRASDEAIIKLRSLVDLDQVLTVMAIEVLTLHWDGYTTSNNYRLYHDPTTDRFDMFPWGTDQTFDWYDYGPWGGYGRMFTFCMENSSCRERYDRILLGTVEHFESLDLESEMDLVLESIEDEIRLDDSREYGMDYVDYYQDRTRELIRTWPAQVREQVLGERGE